MFTVQFSDNKHFPNKKLSLVEGMTILASEEQRVQTAKSSEVVKISIKSSGKGENSDEFTGLIELGKGYGNELLSYIEQELKRTYPKNKAEINLFIEELAAEYAEGRQRSHNKLPSATKITSYGFFSKKQVLIGTVIFVLLLTIMGVFLFVKQSKTIKNASSEQTNVSIEQQENKEDSSMEQLLKKDSASNLGKKYPKRREEIAQALAKTKRFNELEKFQKAYPTTEGAFQVAFYKKDWSKVIQLNTGDFSNEKQIMLVHAYLSLGKISEAEILNEQLKSQTLKKEIKIAKKDKSIHFTQQGKFKEALALQKELKDPDIEELIATGKTCQEMITYYQKEKDTKNQKIWTKRLENLGKDLLSNENEK